MFNLLNLFIFYFTKVICSYQHTNYGGYRSNNYGHNGGYRSNNYGYSGSGSSSSIKKHGECLLWCVASSNDRGFPICLVSGWRIILLSITTILFIVFIFKFSKFRKYSSKMNKNKKL